MITKVRKRDGRLVDYDIGKVENAIAKAMISLGDGEIKDCKKMAKITELNLMEQFEDKIPSVEDIQDIVERVLMKMLPKLIYYIDATMRKLEIFKIQ